MSFNTRFANGVGTNPEELVGAALAGCIAMKLSFVLNGMGFTADNIDAVTKVTLDTELGIISIINVDLTATVPNIDEETFNKAAQETKANCLISNLYKCDIEVNASLIA